MQKILEILINCKSGIDRNELVAISIRMGYREKYIHQLVNLGLIGRTSTVYFLTDKADKVEKACRL